MSKTAATVAIRQKRRWPRKRIGVALALVISALGTWLWTNHIAGSKLRQAEARADRLDPAWHLADIVAGRFKVADEENSAIAVANVVRLMPGGWPKATKRFLGQDAPPGSPSIVEETVQDRVEKLAPNVRLDNALDAAIRRELRSLKPALVRARALAGRDRGHTDLVVPRIVYATLLGHVQNTRQVMRLLEVDSALLAHDGDIDGALDSCRAILAVGRSIGDEPFLVSQLVRMNAAARAMGAAERAMAQGTASDAALARLQALLFDEADQPMLLWGMRGERAATDDVFSKLATGEITAKEIRGLIGNTPAMPIELAASVSGAFIRFNHGLALEMLNEAVEIAKKPMDEQVDLWAAWKSKSTPPTDVLPRFVGSLTFEVLPGVDSVALAYIRTRSMMHAMAATIAAERHRLAHGSFPARLAEIDPKFLPRPPVDAFTGRPILLKPRDGGLIVYSVSLDRKDDGGVELGLKQWDKPGHDLGFRLLPVSARGKPPARTTLPDDVFQYIPGPDEDEPKP
ncbi:MAG: hypothetical protein JWN86_2615 [Planctomycetota bacterium]|nr:hypothetical protein [Planctomycetota bacterium]